MLDTGSSGFDSQEVCPLALRSVWVVEAASLAVLVVAAVIYLAHAPTNLAASIALAYLALLVAAAMVQPTPVWRVLPRPEWPLLPTLALGVFAVVFPHPGLLALMAALARAYSMSIGRWLLRRWFGCDGHAPGAFDVAATLSMAAWAVGVVELFAWAFPGHIEWDVVTRAGVWVLLFILAAAWLDPGRRGKG